IAPDECFDDGALADPAGAGDDDDEWWWPGWAHPRALSKASRCCEPRPWTRRLSAMPISSITLRAFTLPQPGRDSSRDTTLSLPTSASSDDRASERVIPPRLSRALISARAARASAAFCKA